MHIETGTTRVAFVGDISTVKVPKPLVLIRNLQNINDLRRKVDVRTALECLFSPRDVDPSFLRGIQGMLASRRESIYSSELGDLVAPTHAMLGDLMAVQPTTRDVVVPRFSVGDIYREKQMYGKIARGGLRHTLYNSNNYGILNDRVCLRDYGAKGVPQFLLEYREVVHSILREIAELQLG
ncbi:hypothetical protein KJ652_01875 [Patescibacteria group bacterium]|nr:hypothetical protein [Patescibacteria group bacterium]MBU1123313.1 hypothetical protein [Patescibacteria group bacterium]MBU1910853.1 hypothetical protein [Patescibacteria group bacterium]